MIFSATTTTSTTTTTTTTTKPTTTTLNPCPLTPWNNTNSCSTPSQTPPSSPPTTPLDPPAPMPGMSWTAWSDWSDCRKVGDHLIRARDSRYCHDNGSACIGSKMDQITCPIGKNCCYLPVIVKEMRHIEIPKAAPKSPFVIFEN